MAAEGTTKVVAPTSQELNVLRAIARSGFEFRKTLELCNEAGWQLYDDGLDRAFAGYNIPRADDGYWGLLFLRFGADSFRLSPCASQTLFFFDEYDALEVDVDRGPFDQAFFSLEAQLKAELGPPARSGSYTYPHRPHWPYSFSAWETMDATMLLVQDEFDLGQYGLDVTFWVFPPGKPITVPVSE